MQIENHKNHLINSNEFLSRRFKNNQLRVKEIVESYISEDIWNIDRKKILSDEIKLITNNKISPYQSAEKIIDHYKKDILDNLYNNE